MPIVCKYDISLHPEIRHHFDTNVHIYIYTFVCVCNQNCFLPIPLLFVKFKAAAFFPLFLGAKFIFPIYISVTKMLPVQSIYMEFFPVARIGSIEHWFVWVDSVASWTFHAIIFNISFVDENKKHPEQYTLCNYYCWLLMNNTAREW